MAMRDLHEEWPLIEFPDISATILSLFSRGTSESVASALVNELVVAANDDSGHIKLNSEDQLRWVMQVLNYSLTLDFANAREYGTIHSSVSIYIKWLRSLTDMPDPFIPMPMLDTPEKYFRTIVEALRCVFCRRALLGRKCEQSSITLERQASTIEQILDCIRALTQSASRKYQNEVWSRSLSFLLNSADLLLADPGNNEEMGMRIGSQVLDTLFDLWFKAVLNEELPSLTYWRTLHVLCRRWRHHVTVIESWARKLLSMSVLVGRRMYGNDFCSTSFHDDAIAGFADVPMSDDTEPDLLISTWLNFFFLMDSPSSILTHDPTRNKPINGGLVNVVDENRELPQSLPHCFFLAVVAVQRMVDVFYGDSRVSLEFKETDVFLRKWTMSEASAIGQNSTTYETNRYNSSKHKSSLVDDAVFESERRASFSSSVSGRESKPESRNNKTNESDKSGRNDIAEMTASGQAIMAHSLQYTPADIRTLQHGSMPLKMNNMKPSSAHYVAHMLSANPAYAAETCAERSPRGERVLDVCGAWLLGAASALASTSDNGRTETHAHVADDVISGLSLHSLELDEVPDAMSMGERSSNLQAHQRKRQSIGSSASSATGVEGDASGWPTVDGVAAGRAAAMATLTRIVCSKRTVERLPSHQLAAYLAALNHALVEKERIVICSILYYGRDLFRLGLPGVEAVLPHFLFGLDIVLIESSKLKLHPSIEEVEMRRVCLRALSSVVCWPTVFGMGKIPQLAEYANLKSSAMTFLQLRVRIYKTLVFSLRNETDAYNLQLTLAMCSVLMEESCSFDLGLTEDQTREMLKIAMQSHGSAPEKGLCVSLVRGLVSAVCDRLCRLEWAGEHSVSLAAVDMLQALSHVNPAVLFSNTDVSTGSLIVSSLCRFIETQLMKPPPAHSKDLHSTVVAAYNAIAVWLNAAPVLAECEGVLNTVAEAIQLGVTGSKKHEEAEDRKAASKRVLDAAEYLLYSLFSVVGRQAKCGVLDERRLLYHYGPALIDTTRFLHLLVNGDTLLSLHEASHIPALVNDSERSATVIYVRRSPMQTASVGIAKLRSKPNSTRACSSSTGATSTTSENDTNSTAESTLAPSVRSMSTSTMSSGTRSVVSAASAMSAASSVPTGSIISGVPSEHVKLPSSAASVTSASSVVSSKKEECTQESASPPPPLNITISPEFNKMNCKLDAYLRNLECTKETDELTRELEKRLEEPQRAVPRNAWSSFTDVERRAKPKEPSQSCDSLRVLLYDMGLIDLESFGTNIVMLDSGQSADFYRDLHDMVDSCPSRSIQTAHIFYVKNGQRTAIDILSNGANIQNTSADFCGFLAGLGEGIEIGVHDGWTGHWSTAYSNERKPREEADALDHYLLDGVTHSLWWCDNTCEMCFLVPTERSVTIFKQHLSSANLSTPHRNPASLSEDFADGSVDSRVTMATDSTRMTYASTSSYSGSTFQPYSGGGSSMGNAPPSRRSEELRVAIVWLERAEDIDHFPTEELVCACDDGSERNSRTKPAHAFIFLYQVEQGLVLVRSRGSPNRFGEAGPLLDEMVVSLACLPSFIRLTLLNINRRNVAEVENYQFFHIKRKQAIVDFGKKYAAPLTYEDFLGRLLSF